MTGPEHYTEAERLLGLAGHNELGSDVERFHLAAAQVHATLALAAATALGAVGGYPISAPYAGAWNDATGLPS